MLNCYSFVLVLTDFANASTRDYDAAAAQLGRESAQTAAVGVRFVDMCNAVAMRCMSSSSSSSGGSSSSSGGGVGDKHLLHAQRALHAAQVALPAQPSQPLHSSLSQFHTELNRTCSANCAISHALLRPGCPPLITLHACIGDV